jgi:membrane fusion protein, multidrug efflux system
VAGVHVLSPGQKVKRYVPPRSSAPAPVPAAPAASR